MAEQSAEAQAFDQAKAEANLAAAAQEPARFRVRIIDSHSLEVVWVSAPMTERQADRTEAGAGINLNWADFYIDQVPA
jgi:hypothetical protein